MTDDDIRCFIQDDITPDMTLLEILQKWGDEVERESRLDEHDKIMRAIKTITETTDNE